MNSQNYATLLENTLACLFNCEKNGFGGIVNVNYIKYNPFCAILSGLSYKYASSNDELKLKIEKFIKNYSFFSKMTIDELIEFEDNKSNGNLAENMLNALNELL